LTNKTVATLVPRFGFQQQVSASVGRRRNVMDPQIPEDTDSPSDPLHHGADNASRPHRARILLWAVLGAIFPPVLCILLLFSVLRPAIQGKEPHGVGYILWVLGLILLDTVFMLPFGSLTTISNALQNPAVCRSILSVNAVASMGTILIIFLTFRKKGVPNAFVPIRRFRVDKTISFLWLLSLLPLTMLLLPASNFPNSNEIGHPLIIAFIHSLRADSYKSVAIGAVSLVILTPILEEIVFRGLLVEESHEKQRKKIVRYLLDLLVCIFFATLHTPVAFFVPLILAAAFIYVRRRTGSLLPSMVMHACWNFCILVPILRGYA
jgi:membrane protease YdiL (CAAX protease family)